MEKKSNTASTKRKIQINRETVRVLEEEDLSKVAGGSSLRCGRTCQGICTGGGGGGEGPFYDNQY